MIKRIIVSPNYVVHPICKVIYLSGYNRNYNVGAVPLSVRHFIVSNRHVIWYDGDYMIIDF